MLVGDFLDQNVSPLGIQIASVVMISEQYELLNVLGADIQAEVVSLIRVLADLPNDLGKVLAWELVCQY